MKAARNEDGTVIRDSQNKPQWIPDLDDEGNAQYVKKSPMKKDRSGSDKRYSWRLPNPNMDTLYIFEAPLDCWSFMDMLAQQKKLYTPNGEIDTSKFANFLTMGGLNETAIRSFMLDNPHIKKIYLCFDNDAAGKNAAVKFQQYISEQYNIPMENITRFNCPSGYQKLDAHYIGMCDDKGSMVEVKDFNELLRAWKGAGYITNNMARIGEDYAKENKLGKYGSKEFQITQKTKQAYAQIIQNQPGGKQYFPNIPAVPEKRGGLQTAALYRDEHRENMRNYIIRSMRDDGLSPQEKYMQMANQSSRATANVEAPDNSTPDVKPKIKNGDPR